MAADSRNQRKTSRIVELDAVNGNLAVEEVDDVDVDIKEGGIDVDAGPVGQGRGDVEILDDESLEAADLDLADAEIHACALFSLGLEHRAQVFQLELDEEDGAREKDREDQQCQKTNTRTAALAFRARIGI